MTRSCARDLTARINSTSEDLAGMLKRAHDEKAWQALGYETWNAYVKAEIKLCKSRVFQLLDHAEIKGELEKSNMLDSATLPTSSRVTDELKAVPPEQRPTVYAAAVEAAGGQQPTAKQVEAAAFEVLPPERKAQLRPDELDRVRRVEQGQTVVANMRSDHALIEWAESRGIFARVDRKSQWGNPFEMDSPGKQDRDGDRDFVCESFELYLNRKLSLQKQFRDLRGKVIACWCHPLRCHAHFIAKCVNEEAERKPADSLLSQNDKSAQKHTLLTTAVNKVKKPGSRAATSERSEEETLKEINAFLGKLP